MSVHITGRHVEVSPEFREYIASKFPRFEKYTHKLQTVEVVVDKDRYEHCVEVRLQAGPLALTAKKKDPDARKALDLVVDKLEAQFKKAHEKVTKDRKHAGTDAKRLTPGSIGGEAADADEVEHDAVGMKVTSEARRKALAGAARGKTTAAAPMKAAASLNGSRNGSAKEATKAPTPAQGFRRAALKGPATNLPAQFDKIGVRVFSAGPVAVQSMTVEEAAEALYFEDENFLCFNDSQSGTLSVIYRRKDGHFAVAQPEG